MPIRVLIVEDNAVARGFLARVVRESFSDELSFVEAAGIEAASAALDLQGDGTEAFRLIRCDLAQIGRAPPWTPPAPGGADRLAAAFPFLPAPT